MAKASLRQQKTAGRVMHEFKHGELKSGPGGKGGKVRSRKQAIAIALKESGSSKFDSERENKRNLARSKRKEAAGDTGQQEREGKSHLTIGIGCTGGRHRSVVIAEHLARVYEDRGEQLIDVVHRDIDKPPRRP